MTLFILSNFIFVLLFSFQSAFDLLFLLVLIFYNFLCGLLASILVLVFPLFFVFLASLITGLDDFLIVLATFTAPIVALGADFGTCPAVCFAKAAVSSADDKVCSTALAASAATWLLRSSLVVSLTSCTVSLAAVAATCTDSASSITAPLSLNAFTASLVDTAASLIDFATSLTALAVSSALS